MMSLQTVPLYGKHWPPVVDILVQDKEKTIQPTQHTTTQTNNERLSKKIASSTRKATGQSSTRVYREPGLCCFFFLSGCLTRKKKQKKKGKNKIVFHF
jgi:hypothetical protein